MKKLVIINILILCVSIFALSALSPFEQNDNLFLFFKIMPNNYFALGIVVIIIPIIEEFIFRYFIKSKKQFYLITLGVLPLFFINYVIYIPFLIVWLYLISIKKKHTNIYIKILFSSLIFSILHIENYSFYNQFYLILPLIILFCLGNILAIIRIKFGIKYSIITHSIYNLIVLLSIYNSSQNTIKYSNRVSETEIELLKNKFEKREFGKLILDGYKNYPFTISELIEYKLNPISQENIFHKIEKSIISYNGIFNSGNIKTSELINLFDYKTDTVLENKEGFIINLDNSTTQINQTLNIDTSDFLNKKTLIGNNIHNLINHISKETSTPIFINCKDSILSKKISESYYSNLSFRENIHLLNLNQSLNFTLQDTTFSVKIILIKSS